MCVCVCGSFNYIEMFFLQTKDVVYHNEAYSRSNSSVESSPVSSKQSLKERTPSPKSGSFVSAVISAIRNAATHPFATSRSNIDKKSSLDSSKIYKGIYIYRNASNGLRDIYVQVAFNVYSFHA